MILSENRCTLFADHALKSRFTAGD